MMEYLLVERMATRWHAVTLYDGRPAVFKDRMTAEVLADGLRHKARQVRVVEFDPTTEELLTNSVGAI